MSGRFRIEKLEERIAPSAVSAEYGKEKKPHKPKHKHHKHKHKHKHKKY